MGRRRNKQKPSDKLGLRTDVPKLKRKGWLLKADQMLRGLKDAGTAQPTPAFEVVADVETPFERPCLPVYAPFRALPVDGLPGWIGWLEAWGDEDEEFSVRRIHGDPNGAIEVPTYASSGGERLCSLRLTIAPSGAGNQGELRPTSAAEALSGVRSNRAREEWLAVRATVVEPPTDEEMGYDPDETVAVLSGIDPNSAGPGLGYSGYQRPRGATDRGEAVEDWARSQPPEGLAPRCRFSLLVWCPRQHRVMEVLPDGSERPLADESGLSADVRERIAQRRADAETTAAVAEIGEVPIGELISVGQIEGRVIAFSSMAERMYAVDPESSDLSWEAAVGTQTPPVLFRKHIVALSRGASPKITLWDPASGKRLGEHALPPRVPPEDPQPAFYPENWFLERPVEWAGGLYLMSVRGTLYRVDIGGRGKEIRLSVAYQLANPKRPSSQALPEVVGDHLVVPWFWSRKATLSERLRGVVRPLDGWDQWQAWFLVLSMDRGTAPILYMAEHVGERFERFAREVANPLSFQPMMADALFRCRWYYYRARDFPFEHVFPLMSGARERLDPQHREVTVGEIYEEVYAALKEAFPYLKPLPPLHELLFEDRASASARAPLLRIDRARAQPVISASSASEAARYLARQIAAEGGFEKLPRTRVAGETTVFTTLRSLSGADRAFVYESEVLRSGFISRVIANNTAFALLEAGYPTRAIYYYYLSGMLPREEPSSGVKLEDGEFGVDIEYLLRALAQRRVFGDGAPRSEVIRAITEGTGPGAFYFRGGTTTGELAEHHLSEVEAELIKGQVGRAASKFFSHARPAFVRQVTRSPNERVGADTVARFHQRALALADAALQERDAETALRVVESAKGLSLSLLMSPENRRRLLDRLERDPFYTALREALGASAESHTNERGALRSVEAAVEQPGLRAVMGLEAFGAPVLDPLPPLPPTSALIEYYVGPSEAGAFVRYGEDLAFAPLPGLRTVDRLVEKAAALLRAKPTGEGGRRALDVVLGKLYDVLLRPLRPLLGGAASLVVVPTGHLFRVPFTALHDGVQALVDDVAVVVVPSSSIFSRCASKPQSTGGAVAFLRGDHEELPYVDAEQTAVTEAWMHDVDVFDSAAPLTRAETYGAVHVAAHGIFVQDSPLQSAIDLGSGGSLSVLDLYGLDLAACDFAVVNTCVSGRVQIDAADDIVGLVRGFIAAGCPSVVNTLWPLADEVGPVFANAFYPQVAKGLSLSEAFRNAIQTVRQTGTFAHPYYWANYQLFGRL